MKPGVFTTDSNENLWIEKVLCSPGTVCQPCGQTFQSVLGADSDIVSVLGLPATDGTTTESMSTNHDYADYHQNALKVQSAGELESLQQFADLLLK